MKGVWGLTEECCIGSYGVIIHDVFFVCVCAGDSEFSELVDHIKVE